MICTIYAHSFCKQLSDKGFPENVNILRCLDHNFNTSPSGLRFELEFGFGLGLNLGLGLGLVGLGRVTVKGWLMHYAYKSPQKDRYTRMCVCVCVNTPGLWWMYPFLASCGPISHCYAKAASPERCGEWTPVWAGASLSGSVNTSVCEFSWGHQHPSTSQDHSSLKVTGGH